MCTCEQSHPYSFLFLQDRAWLRSGRIEKETSEFPEKGKERKKRQLTKREMKDMKNVNIGDVNNWCWKGVGKERRKDNREKIEIAEMWQCKESFGGLRGYSKDKRKKRTKENKEEKNMTKFTDMWSFDRTKEKEKKRDKGRRGGGGRRCAPSTLTPHTPSPSLPHVLVSRNISNR